MILYLEGAALESAHTPKVALASEARRAVRYTSIQILGSVRL